MIPRIVRQGNGVVGVAGKPGVALVEAAANLAGIVVEDNLPAVDLAGQPGPRDLDLGRFVARHPRVGNRDAPEPG